MNGNILKNTLTTIVLAFVTTAALAQDATSSIATPPLVPAVPTSTAAPTLAPTPADKPLNFGGKFGIGYEYIRVDEVQNTSNLNLNTYSLLSLDATYWLSDQAALDILATANLGSNLGFDFNGDPTNFPNTTWGAGLLLRTNLAAPIRNLRLQGLFRATYGQFTQQQVNWNNENITYRIQDCYSETFLISAGLGFEYFMPFCDSLSVQGNIAYAGAYNDGWISESFNPSQHLGHTNYTMTYSNYRTAFVLTGLTLSGVSVHFYF